LSDDALTQTGFAAQFPKNLIANIAYILVNLIIGILLVPYFISTLRVAAYGIIPLATSLTGYVAIVVQSLNAAISRYLTVDLQQENYSAANRTFNTAFFGLSAVLLLMVPIVLQIAHFVPSVFHIPAGQEMGATLFFLGVCASFLLRSWSGNYTVQLFAYNRLDLQNLVNLANILVQTGLIVLFFTLFGPDLGLVGAAYLIGATAASLVSIVLSLLPGWGYYGFAAAGAIVLTMKNALFTPWYAARVLEARWQTFTWSILPGIVATLLLWALATVLGLLLPLATLAPLIIAGGVLSLGYLVLVWRFGLSLHERQLFGVYLPERIRWVCL